MNAQKKVINRLKEIGGVGWVGDGVEKETQTYDNQWWEANFEKFFGNKEFERYKKNKKKFGISNKGSWCSHITLVKLLNNKLIEPIEEIPGCFRLC